MEETMLVRRFSTSLDWNGNLGYDVAFLEAQKKYLNSLKNAKGYVFIDEVCNYIGLSYKDYMNSRLFGWIEDPVSFDLICEDDEIWIVFQGAREIFSELRGENESGIIESDSYTRVSFVPPKPYCRGCKWLGTDVLHWDWKCHHPKFGVLGAYFYNETKATSCVGYTKPEGGLLD